MLDQRTGGEPPEAAPAVGTRRLRVLFLPKNRRKAYFQSLLAAARAREGWDIRVVCSDSTRRLWRDVVSGDDSFHPMPDFSRREDWEDDPRRVAEIDAFIAECERRHEVPLGRIVVAGERDLGRSYSQPAYYWFHNEIARRALTDNTEPFRVVRRMIAFARETLLAARPDLLLGGEWADPHCFVFFFAARKMGIPCVVNRYSKVWSGRCFWSAEPLMYNGSGRVLTAEKRRTHAPVSERARQHIAEFRERPTTVRYLKAHWEKVERTTWLARHMVFARMFAGQMRDRFARRSGPPPKPVLQLLWDYYRRAWLKRRQAKYFRRFNDESLAELPYLFVALHKDPEQALNYQAPFWLNQPNTIALVSGCLPAGYSLLVREHRHNTGRKPTRYYKEMAALPGVVPVDAFDSQFKYMQNADLIVTDNSSCGWEGLLLGRRVITMADSFFDGAGLGRRVRELKDLGSAIVESLAKPAVEDAAAHDCALGWFLDAEWETSAPLEADGHPRALDLLAELYARLSRSPADAA